MNLQPLYEKVIVKNRTKQEKTSESGLTVISDFSKSANTTLIADVVAVGEGRLLADGNILPLKVKVGDQVIYSKMSGESFNDGKDDFTILSEQNILVIIQGE